MTNAGLEENFDNFVTQFFGQVNQAGPKNKHSQYRAGNLWAIGAIV